MKHKRGFLLGLLCVVTSLMACVQPFLRNESNRLLTVEKAPSAFSRDSINSASSLQNVTLAQDIIVESGTYTIENMELHLIGKITVDNGANLMIRNAKLYLSGDYLMSRDAIVLNSKSKLIAENASIIAQPSGYSTPSYIVANDEAQVNMTDSKLSGWAYVISRDGSRIYLENASLAGPDPDDSQRCAVVTEGNSTAVIKDSTLDLAQARDRSAIYIMNSTVKPKGVSLSENGTIEIRNSDVGFSYYLWGSSTLQIFNSTIEGMYSEGSLLLVEDCLVRDLVGVKGSAVAWLKRTSVSRVEARDTSTVWLINTAAKRIWTYDSANVYIGWQLPIFGIVSVPHWWIPIIQGLALLLVLSLIITAIILLNRRWKQRQIKQQTEQELNACA